MSESEEAALPRLTTKQHTFVLAYIENGGIGRDAARTAGYGNGKASNESLDSHGSRTLSNDKVQAHIQYHWRKNAIGPDELLNIIGRQARFHKGMVLDEFGQVDPLKVKEHGYAYKAVRLTKHGTEYVPMDPQKAQHMAAQAQGMLVQRKEVQHSGNIGFNLDDAVEALKDLDSEEG